MNGDKIHLYEGFTLDTTCGGLLRDGQVVHLRPQTYEVLKYLVENRGRLISKNEFNEKVWQGQAVTDGSLGKCIEEVRDALGENATKYVRNVRGRGYIFDNEENGEREKIEAVSAVTTEQVDILSMVVVDEVKEDRASDTSRRKRQHRFIFAAAFSILLLGAVGLTYRLFPGQSSVGGSSDSPQIKSIAVLPFKTMGIEGGNEYLGLGMSDALITKLGNVHQIVLRPTSAVRKYAGEREDPVAAGREQGVDAVLDGSIQRDGDRIRVTVQLIRVKDKALLWSERFDERFVDIFTVQDSISQQVMRELMIELNPEERQRLQRRGSENVEAYQAYLKGLYFWNKRAKDGYQKAVESFNKAIEKDPTYAQAYVGLGNAYAYLGGHDAASQSDAIARQRAATKRALELDETLSEAHATLGLIAMNTDWDWAEAEREFKRAIELNPNYATAHAWYGEFLADMGRFEEGVAEIKRGQELDPLSLVINTDVAKVYMLARRYDEAIEQYKRALELDPEFEVAHGLLALTYSLKGMHEEALSELRKIKNLEKDPMYLSFLGYVDARAGKRDEAREVLKRMESLSKQTYASPLWMTIVYAGLGEKDEAFKWFERVFDERTTGGTIALKVSPVYDSLRSDPRFSDLMQRTRFASEIFTAQRR
jgi:TolB-like protein/DNA-binding winged helix-turn-helix (wHTH) protein/Tfp pilus assembly protein PilF